MGIDVKSAVEHQLNMNKETYQHLLELGLRDNTLVPLEFAYEAHDRESAEKLVQYLQAETDYDVCIEPSELSDDECIVVGSTQPTHVSLDILNQWVKWMIVAGARFESDFDGWGTDSGLWESG